MNAKSRTNSFSVWLSSTRFEYTPCATSSSIWTWSLGVVGSSDMDCTLSHTLVRLAGTRGGNLPWRPCFPSASHGTRRNDACAIGCVRWLAMKAGVAAPPSGRGWLLDWTACGPPPTELLCQNGTRTRRSCRKRAFPGRADRGLRARPCWPGTCSVQRQASANRQATLLAHCSSLHVSGHASGHVGSDNNKRFTRATQLSKVST